MMKVTTLLTLLTLLTLGTRIVDGQNGEDDGPVGTESNPEEESDIQDTPEQTVSGISDEDQTSSSNNSSSSSNPDVNSELPSSVVEASDEINDFLSDKQESCPAGHRCVPVLECLPCGYGSFMEVAGSNRVCSLCPEGCTTLRKGATSWMECVKKCPEGHEESDDGVTCRRCPPGTYKTTWDNVPCTTCPNDDYDPGLVGLVSESDCYTSSSTSRPIVSSSTQGSTSQWPSLSTSRSTSSSTPPSTPEYTPSSTSGSTTQSTPRSTSGEKSGESSESTSDWTSGSTRGSTLGPISGSSSESTSRSTPGETPGESTEPTSGPTSGSTVRYTSESTSVSTSGATSSSTSGSNSTSHSTSSVTSTSTSSPTPDPTTSSWTTRFTASSSSSSMSTTSPTTEGTAENTTPGWREHWVYVYGTVSFTPAPLLEGIIWEDVTNSDFNAYHGVTWMAEIARLNFMTNVTINSVSFTVNNDPDSVGTYAGKYVASIWVTDPKFIPQAITDACLADTGYGTFGVHETLENYVDVDDASIYHGYYYDVDAELAADGCPVAQCSMEQPYATFYPCAYFCQCDHGQWAKRPCAPGTKFSTAVGVCDHPIKTDCQDPEEG